MDEKGALLARRVATAAAAWFNAPRDTDAYRRLSEAVDEWNGYAAPRFTDGVDEELLDDVLSGVTGQGVVRADRQRGIADHPRELGRDVHHVGNDGLGRTVDGATDLQVGTPHRRSLEQGHAVTLSRDEMVGSLKRPDEKYVTERAYDNPKFVEDMVRDVAVRMNNEDRVAAYVVESENFESIHNHSAYALIEHDKDASRG